MRLIDADALTKELAEDMKYDCSYYHDWTQKETRDAKYSFAIDRIASAPTIDVVPVVNGRWKYYHKQNIAVCTNCSFERDLNSNFGKAICCPNCGAKMDGDADV